MPHRAGGQEDGPWDGARDRGQGCGRPPSESVMVRAESGVLRLADHRCACGPARTVSVTRQPRKQRSKPRPQSSRGRRAGPQSS